jgi:hypothetical protein
MLPPPEALAYRAVAFGLNDFYVNVNLKIPAFSAGLL